MSERAFEFDPAVIRVLERYAPMPDQSVEWDLVLHRAHVVGRPPRRRLLVLALMAGVVMLLVLATPLGGAIRGLVADFSRWLTGTPGTAVSEEKQREFDQAQARSWVAFPGSPKLRQLSRVEKDGVTYDLVGFRSADSLCIRVITSGAVHDRRLTCAPVDELRNDDVPVRVLFADWGIGKGDKREQIGFSTYSSARAQVTAGIAADGVESIDLHDDQGSHRVPAVSNAFLYVAERPEVGQRVMEIRAQLADGQPVEVPFTVAPWAFGDFGGASGVPGGPTKVEREIDTGEIGWVARHDERGAPIDDSLRDKFHAFSNISFGRVLTPDPNSPKRLAITIGAPGGHGAAMSSALCETLLASDGTAAGGCLDSRFRHGPFSFGYSVSGAGDQYATFAGVASDDVARLELFTATGSKLEVPLRDNAYLAEVALARLPAKLVAYDKQGRVIGIEQTPRSEGPARLISPPILHLSVAADGVGTIELLANKTREGGQCWEAKGTGKVSFRGGSCIGTRWTVAPLRVAPIPDPAVFLYGRAREDIRTLTLRYADGEQSELTPGKYGYVLALIPAEHRRTGHQLVALTGRGEDGRIIAREDFRRR
jgi:hypothetical protein